jgi:outer membrane receptor protein involved in Fe transport
MTSYHQSGLFTRVVPATLLALLVSVGSLSAQEAAKPAEEKSGDVVKLSPFSVESDTYKGYVASSTIVGGKTAMKIIDVPQTVNVVTRELIDDTAAFEPVEAMTKIVPGVSNFAGPQGPNAGITIRGFRAQNWSIDGATMRALSMVANYNFDSFEVIKGPASVTFGAFAAYGGYISVMPKYANRNQKNKLELSVGTDSFYSAMADVGGKLGEDGDLQYRLVIGQLDAERPGWNWDFNQFGTIAPSFSYDISDKSRLKVRFEFSNLEQKLSSTALDVNGNVIESFSSNGPENPRNHVNKEINESMQMVWETQLSDEWSTRMNIFGSLGDKKFDQVSLIGQAAAADYLFNNFMAHYWWKNFYVDYSVSWKIDEIANTAHQQPPGGQREHGSLGHHLPAVRRQPDPALQHPPDQPERPGLDRLSGPHVYLSHPLHLLQHGVARWCGDRGCGRPL